MKLGKKFAPHPNLKKVYYTYIGLAAIVPMFSALLVIAVALVFAKTTLELVASFVPLIALLAVLGFVAYWVQRYYDSISFMLTSHEVVVERGVWWKMKHVVPYARVMSVDTIQGPISRHFGIGSALVYTAGYTGPSGGTSGPGSRGAEASIWGVPNFLEIKDSIINSVRGKPLFGTSKSDVGPEILKELKGIRKAVEK